MSQIHPIVGPKIEETGNSNFSIIWDDLSYNVIKSNTEMFIEKYILQKKDPQKTKTIFTGLCGEFKCGELNALMGPSGAGKSTLLECLCGKREKGKSGFVGLTGNQKVNIAFIPQQDNFFSLLTVREALLFASKLQNSDIKINVDFIPETVTEVPTPRPSLKPQSFHENIVESILDQLSLNACAEVRISNLSGGQQKRLSIAQELVAKPDVLILDEPTSGLDSSSCFQTVELLRKLAEQSPPIAVIVTIHQPSAKVFNLFHRIYVLSVVGKCIFNGPPNKIIPWLSGFNLHSPEYYNPADFIIEISYGEYGKECLFKMSDTIISQNKMVKGSYLNREAKNLQEEIFVRDYTYSLKHVRIIAHRTSLYLFRDPLSFAFRLFIHLIVGISMGGLYAGMGSEGGCPPDLSNGVQLEKIDKLKKEIEGVSDTVYNNLGCMFFALVFTLFQGVLLNVIMFPLTIRAIQKETSNGWYSELSYFVGFSIAGLPSQILNSVLFSTIIYTMTGQPYELRRYMEFCLLYLLLSMVSLAHGTIMGLIFVSNITAAVFVAPASCIPFLLFSGFLLKTENIPYFLRFFSYISYMRYAVDGLLIAVFGNLRCGEGSGELVKMARDQIKLFMYSIFRIVRNSLDEDYEDEEGGAGILPTNSTEILVDGLMPSYLDKAEVDNEGNLVSYVMHEFKLTNHSFYNCILMLFIFAILLRVIAYILFKKKVNASK